MSKWKCLILMAIIWTAGTAKADFVLYGTDQNVVDRYHLNGTLYAQSTVRIPDEFEPWSVDSLKAYHESNVYVSGGSVDDFYAYDSTTVEISGGFVDYFHTSDSSTVEISGGSVNFVNTYSTVPMNITNGSIDYIQVNRDSIVNVFDGTIDNVTTTYNGITNIFGGDFDIVNCFAGYQYNDEWVPGGTVNISGGTINTLIANGNYNDGVTIYARNFFLGDGLSLSDDRIIGKGILSAQWFDGTGWVMYVEADEVGISIPEPATLTLLIFGSVLALRRKGK